MNAATSASEDQELVPKGRGVLVLEGIVEARVPGVEQHSNAHLNELNRKDGGKEASTSPPVV